MLPIVRWQYEKIEGTLGLLEEHLADPDCPCRSEGESCARKHLKRAEDYASETLTILSRHKGYEEEIGKLQELSAEARAYRRTEEESLCGKEVEEKDLVTTGWASTWRKYFETMLVGNCATIARMAEVDDELNALIDEVARRSEQASDTATLGEVGDHSYDLRVKVDVPEQERQETDGLEEVLDALAHAEPV